MTMSIKVPAKLLLLLSLPALVASFASDVLASKSVVRRSKSSLRSSAAEIDWQTKLVAETKEISSCISIVGSALFKPDKEVGAEDIVKICDTIDETTPDLNLFVSRELDLRTRALKIQRYEWLAKLLKSDYDAYVATASFLSPSRIPRMELPNLQDVPIDKDAVPKSGFSEDGVQLVADCDLEDMKYTESPLDKLLLSIFRKLVVKNTGGVSSEKEGIEGLLEQGRTFMLQPGQTPEVQHKMVSDTLGGLMTPVLPPFYRIFMSGIVPKLGTDMSASNLVHGFMPLFLLRL